MWGWVIKNIRTNLWVRKQRKENLCALLVGEEICAFTMEDVMGVLQIIKHWIILWFKSFSSGYLPKENEKTNLKRHMPCSIIYNSQDMESTRVFTERRVDKEDILIYHIYSRTLLSHKNTEILPFWHTG